MSMKAILLLLALPLVLRGQPKILESYFSQLKAGKYPNIPNEVNRAENADPFLNAIGVYLKDTVAIVRLRAIAMSYDIGNKSKISALRSKAVAQIMNAARDHNSANSGAALTYLTHFLKTDFSKAAKDSLKTLLASRPPHIDVLVKLIGFLELNDSMNDLYAITQNPSIGRKERWSAMLALARMNDELAAQDVVNRIRRMPVTDAVVYQVFPDLVYTRNREAINILIEALNSDAKNCESADAERSGKIPCAYRVMEMLAPAIEGYPLKLSESGDIQTADYPGALQIVRNWFKEHPDYKISKDKF